ncbi:MAG: hypothetical protein AAF823_06340 [Planctomycetota bacterium]
MADQMNHNGLLAKAYRRELRQWRGPERLHEAESLAEIASVVHRAEHEREYQLIRRFIAEKRWATLKEASSFDPMADDIVWYLVIGPNDGRWVVETLSYFEPYLIGDIRDVWRIDKKDEQTLRSLDLSFYSLKATELGDWGRWVSRQANRLKNLMHSGSSAHR